MARLSENARAGLSAIKAWARSAGLPDDPDEHYDFTEEAIVDMLLYLREAWAYEPELSPHGAKELLRRAHKRFAAAF